MPTQHCRREKRKSLRPPRVSQMPSSGWSQVSARRSTPSRISVPGVVIDGAAVLVVDVDRVDQLPVDVELELGGRLVAHAYGTRPTVTLQVVELLLLQVGAAVHAVHDPQPVDLARLHLAEAVGQPLHELLGRVVESEQEQRVEREGRVADPRVAVVPVSRAADLLGEARGRGGDDCARRLVGEQLQRERRALHHLAPASPVVGLREPAAPVRDCFPGEILRLPPAARARDNRLLHRLEHEARRLARRETESSAHARGRPFERRARGQRDGQLGGFEQRTVLRRGGVLCRLRP